MVGIPMREALGAGTWDQLPGVALKTAVAGSIRLLARASCGYVEGNGKAVLVNGWVVSHGHNLGEDSIVSCVFDDRHIFAAYFTCFGKMTWDPGQQKAYFVSNPNDPLVFNRWGHGDCIEDRNGRPRFAPGHRYGHIGSSEADSPDPEPGYATSMTRKWRVSDIIKYLEDMFYSIGYRPPLGGDFGLMELPRQYLDWPKDLASVIVEDKTPHTFSLEGANLLEALVKTVQYAGPYELNLEPVDDVKSRLQIIDFSKRANKGATIYGPDYIGTLEGNADNASVAAEGQIKQHALGYAYDIAYCGDSPAIEFMASTDPGDGDSYGGALSFGWSAQEEALFKIGLPTGSDSLTFNFQCKLRPNVYCWYRLAHGIDPFKLSKYGTRTESGNWRIKPHQLTAYNENPASPAGLVHREIVVEFKLTQYEYERYSPEDREKYGWWRVASRYSELQLDPSGRYIMLPALRDVAQTYVTDPERKKDGSPKPPDYTEWQGAYFKPRQIRIQVVAESDACLVARRGGDPNLAEQHIDPAAPKFTFLKRNEPLQYIDWLRGDKSRPIGIAWPTNLKNWTMLSFQPKQSRGNELFSDCLGDHNLADGRNRLDRHADAYLQNLKRISWEGTYVIKRISPCYHVGQVITYEAPNRLNGATSVIRCIVYHADNQTTTLEVGPPALSTIWDGPLHSNSYGGSGGTSAPTYGGGGDKYDKPYEEPTSKQEEQPTTSGSDQFGNPTGTAYGPDSWQFKAQQAEKAKQAAEQKPQAEKKPEPRYKASDEGGDKKYADRGNYYDNRAKNMKAELSKMDQDDPRRQKLQRMLDRTEAKRDKAGAKMDQLNSGHGAMRDPSGRSIKAGELGNLTKGWDPDNFTKGFGRSFGAWDKMQDYTVGKKSAIARGFDAKMGGAGGEGGQFDTKKASAWSEKRFGQNKQAEYDRAIASSERFSKSGWGGTAGRSMEGLGIFDNTGKPDTSRNMWSGADAKGRAIQNPNYRGDRPTPEPQPAPTQAAPSQAPSPATPQRRDTLGRSRRDIDLENMRGE
jgi:hypothetical protein